MEKYTIKIENFEGPLDLLCFLIDKNKLNIFEINIADITDQYIEYIQGMEEMNLEVASEFIVMAAKLLYVKSKNLLPTEKEEVEEIEIDIIKQIVEYKKYKEFVEVLKANHSTSGNQFFKIAEAFKFPRKKITKQYDKELIADIYEQILRRNMEKINVNADNVQRLAIHEHVTVKSKVKEMLKTLIKSTSFVFNKLFCTKKREKIEVVTAFLGMLELAKSKRVTLQQDKLFGDIVVEKICE